MQVLIFISRHGVEMLFSWMEHSHSIIVVYFLVFEYLLPMHQKEDQFQMQFVECPMGYTEGGQKVILCLVSRITRIYCESNICPEEVLTPSEDCTLNVSSPFTLQVCWHVTREAYTLL